MAIIVLRIITATLIASSEHAEQIVFALPDSAIQGMNALTWRVEMCAKLPLR